MTAGDRDEWGGHDLRGRKEKIDRAFRRGEVMRAEDVPVIVGTPTYFSFGSRDKPVDYFENPASMVSYQERSAEKHLREIRDDYVPYFMPWFGTGVMAAAYGCPYRLENEPGQDPAVLGACVEKVTDISRLKMPDSSSSPIMRRVLDCIGVALRTSDLPVGLTDINSPLSTLGQMCGATNLYTWMYTEPRAVHDLMDMVSDALISWVRTQKDLIGEPDGYSNGLQGVWSPRGGVWLSDDDLVLIGPDLYEEFVVPRYSKIFSSFGGGHLHFCGNGSHQARNISKIQGLTAVNNSPMYGMAAFTHLAAELRGGLVLELQDVAPIDAGYYGKLIPCMDSLDGVMIATFVVDTLGMAEDGVSVPIQWNCSDQANRIVDSVRGAVQTFLDSPRAGRGEAS